MKKSSIRTKWFEKTYDEIIKYEYSAFNNIEPIAKGGFSTVYSAVYYGEKFALKNIDSDDEEVSKEFIKELKQLMVINSHPNINKLHGITQDPKTNKFMLVLQFANGGNLRQYLQNQWHEGTFKISLGEVIDFARQITNGLKHLHYNNIIHCDLHSKNILINDRKLLIADFALSSKINDTYNTTASIIKGMPAYLDPDFHTKPGKKPDKKSDIYSLGVLFWELTSGVCPFANAISGLAILIQTLKGYREQPIPGTPIDYVKLYKKCWNAEPNERPTISQILDNLDLILARNTIKYIINCNKQLIPELDINVHNDDDLTKTLLKEASVLKPTRPSYSSSKTSENSITKTSNETSGRKLFFSSLKSSGDSLTKSVKEHFFQRKQRKFDNAEELKSRGQIYYISGNYKESLKYLKNSLSIYPDDADALRFRGETYFKLKKYQESLADLSRSLELEPDNAVALRSRGKTYYMINCYEETLVDLTNSLEIDPDNANALRFRGQAFYALNRYEDSLADLNKLNEIEPNNAVTLRLRGEIYYSLKRYEESLEDLTRSLKINPDNAIALRLRGKVCYKLEKYDKSIIYLNESLRFDPKNVDALIFLGYSYFEIKKFKESSKIWSELLKIDSKNAVALEFLGRSYYNLKKYDKSRETLTKLLNIDPKNITALRTRGQTYCMTGKYVNSLEDLNKALEIYPNDAESLRARGTTLYHLHKYDESLIDLTESLEIEPDNPFALDSRGQTYYMLNRYEESLANLVKCLEVDPNNPNRAATLRLGGEVCYMLKCYYKSLKYLTESLELEPKNAVALKFLAQSYFELKRYKESSENLIKLLKIDPKSAIALELLGRSYYKLGDGVESVEILTKLLNLNNESENNNALRTRGQAYCMLGNYDNSLKDLNKVLEINPYDAEALRARGITYYNLEKYKKSLEDLTKSLEIEQDHPFALRSRGKTHLKLCHYEESLVDLNKSLELEPDNLDALKSRAKTYSELGRKEELQVDLDKILLIEERERKEESRKNLMKSLSLEEHERHEEFQNRRMKPEQNNEFLNKPIIDQSLIKNNQPITDQQSIKNIEVSSHVNSFEINLTDNQANIGKYHSILSNYALKEFDDSSEDQKLVKAWRLNHGLYLAGNNFIPSNRIIFGYNGKLDIVTCSREPLVYTVANDSSDRPKSFWDKLRDSYPEFSSTKESPFNDICEADVCLLFPIAEITYSGTINKGSKLDLNSEKEAFITDNYAEYGHFFAKKLLAGGKLILRNFADANSVQIEHFKSHLAWALDSHQSQRENPFEDATIFDFPIIETTNKNLKNPKDLSMWIRRLYEDNMVEIISYEEIIPIFTFLEKVEYTYNSDTFINRLIPGISNKHQEITLNDWIEDLPLRNLLTLISKFPFRHGMLVDQFGISLPNNQALAFTQSPIVSKRNNYYLQLIHPETSMEEILLRNKVTHKLSSIPFIEYNSTTQIDNVYLFLHYEKIEIFLDQCVAPLPVFKKAVEDAVRSIHPYRALQEVFNEFGHFLPKSIVLGSQLREILKKQMNTSSHALIKKKFVAASQADVDKILECTKVFDINYLLTSNGQVVMMDQIFDWFSEIENNDEYLKFIRIDQVTPLYKILSYDLQNKIEIILENRLDSRILLTGVKTFDMDDNSTEAYVRINFDENSVLDSSCYDAIGLVFDNKNIRSEDCAISFGLFDCYGFSAFITVKDSTARNIKGWHIIWMIIGKHSLVGAFSENQRETDIAFHNEFVDLTTCYDDFIYIPLSFVLSKNCIILFSTLYSANNPPEQNFKLTRWSKDVLELKITKLNMDQTQLSPFYLNICAVYPREKMTFKVDFGDKLVAHNILGHNLDANNYDQLIDFNCFKNIFLNCLNAELPVKHIEYLCTSNFGYWTIATSETDNSQLAIKHIIKRRLSGLIQSYDTVIPLEAYFMQEINHKNLVKYINTLETETTFLLITELDCSIRSTNWKTLHHHLKHKGALSEHQAKNIFKQVIECVSFIYKHGFYNIIINDRNILIAESQVKLFNLEHLMSDEFNNDLVYDIQYEDDYSISFASPEMISGHDYNPECSDLWCLGILLFTMIHADVPFKKPFDIIARNLVLEKEVSKECSDILHRLLAKKPHLRGSFKYLLKDPWIGINASSKRIVLNNSIENVDKGIIDENTSSDEIVQELDELIKESQNDIRSFPLQWIPSNSLSDIKSIGKGGFGSVFSATWINPSIITYTSNKHPFYWQSTLTKVALKEYLNINEDDGFKNLLREMKNHAKMNGLWGIIDFYGIAYGHKPEDLKIVLHYADKSDLNEYLKRNFVSITWKKKLSIILDIAVGLYQIHDKGIIHRDIHPGNIFLDSSCTCIGDFGLSREADMLTDYKNKLFGVLPYMAPEVLEEGKYSYASDIYAFGIILIKIATGKNVYIGNNNDKLAFDKSIPSIYQNMIDSCCDKKPSNRPNALTLANEIIDWKLNKMHQFNDKKRLLSFTNEETGENEENEDTEEMVGKSQNDIILDQEIKSVDIKSNIFGEYYKNATDGDPEAVKNVAICFLTGNGIERNMKEAFSWFMRCRNKVELTHEELTPLVEYFSQDSPDLEIKMRYGMMLECGLGVVKSLDNAYLVYKNAAESGHARAQFKMGVFCEKGWGRKKDLKEAFHWFIKAIKQNSLEALNYINKRYMVSFKPRGKSITIKVNTECLLSKEVTDKVTKIIVKDEHAELSAD